MNKGQIDNHHAEKATGIGDPQCFSGEAGPAKFKVGDRVRVRNLPDVFYTRCQYYTRGAVGEVVAVVYESPAPEDESFGNEDNPMWFYSVAFRQHDLWEEYPSGFPNDTLETEFSEWALEPA